jgi:hypothetical protein
MDNTRNCNNNNNNGNNDGGNNQDVNPPPPPPPTLEHVLIIVIPHSEKEGMKPPYLCPGCSNHTYGNNMINRRNVTNKQVLFLT